MPPDQRRDVFQAIADPNRRRMIDLLVKEPLTINVLADKFQISRPAVSQHIKHLVECGIVEIKTKGRERHCKIKPGSLVPAFLWLEKFQQQWKERIDLFEEYINQTQSKTKKRKK